MPQKTKQEIAIQQQFLHILVQIIELFPQYTVTQHIVHFTRKKGEQKESYYWSEELALQKIQEYYDELCTNLLTNKTEIDE